MIYLEDKILFLHVMKLLNSYFFIFNYVKILTFSIKILKQLYRLIFQNKKSYNKHERFNDRELNTNAFSSKSKL